MTSEEVSIMLTRHDGQIERHEGRIKDIEDRQDKLDGLVTSMATMAQKQTIMENDISEIKTDVKALTGKPAKWLDVIISCLVTGVIAFILGKFLI